MEKAENEKKEVRYVAMPENVYMGILTFLKKQPYDVIKDFVELIEKSVQVAKLTEDVTAKENDKAVNGTTTEISSIS